MTTFTAASNSRQFSAASHIYAGKFNERSPEITTAGMLTYQGGDTVKQCLTLPPKPPSPADIRRHRQWVYPSLDTRRIHHGIARDPQIEESRKMTHGISYPQGTGAAEILNPTPKTLYQQRFIDRLESVYQQPKRAPLGRVPSTQDKLPSHIDLKNHRFGCKSAQVTHAAELLNPPVSYAEIYAQDREDHDTYLKPFKRLYPGEQPYRAYNNKFNSDNVFGDSTLSDTLGRATKECFTWSTDQRAQKTTPLVEKRLDDFRERTQFQLGRTLDPIKDTRKVGEDHVYGITYKSDPMTVQKLLTGDVPIHCVQGNNKERGIVGACRSYLKNEGFHNLPDLMEAFNQLDKDGSGFITMDMVRSVFQQFNVPLSLELLEQLLDYCDGDHEDRVNWREMIECLNWKDRISFRNLRPAKLSLDIDVQSAPAGGERSTPRRIQQNVRRGLVDWTTTNAMYNGGGGLDSRRLCRYGAPSMRTTEFIPKTRRVGESKVNYGDEPSAHSLLNPSVLSTYGVSEIDLMLPRTKEDIRNLFSKIGVEMSNEVFEETWRLAGEQHPAGEVNIDSFRSIVDGMEAHKIRSQLDAENCF